MIDLAALEVIATRAVPNTKPDGAPRWYVLPEQLGCGCSGPDHGPQPEEAAFIIAASPDVVLVLIRELRAAKQALYEAATAETSLRKREDVERQLGQSKHAGMVIRELQAERRELRRQLAELTPR